MRQLNLLSKGNSLKHFPLKLLILLLVADLIFILLYIACWLPSSSYISITLSQLFPQQELLWLTKEQSYAEVFQYIKELWIVLILGFGCWQRRSWLFLAWTLVFSYLLLDDCLSIHEAVGTQISDLLQFQNAFNLRAVDFGEVLFSILVAMSFLLIISWAYTRSSSIERKYGNVLILCLFALAIAGILFDLIHVIVYDNRYLNLIFALLEDGGEQIIMSFTLAFVYGIDWQYDLKLPNRDLSIRDRRSVFKRHKF